ncbi:MAG: dihydrofolate reductase [Erysipelotrichaceae bacterium]|nr:dihydrofolate reductase [Erysipelotrichaceae bacterium]
MISLIVAVDPNFGIGLNDTLPWHIKEDLKLFKETTLNQTIVMGEKTFFGLPKPLPNRKTIVVSLDPDCHAEHEDVTVCHDLIGLLEEYKKTDKNLFICGGATIYRLSLPYADKLCISFVKESYNVDTYFPPVCWEDFTLSYEEDKGPFVYREFVRKGA